MVLKWSFSKGVKAYSEGCRSWYREVELASRQQQHCNLRSVVSIPATELWCQFVKYGESAACAHGWRVLGVHGNPTWTVIVARPAVPYLTSMECTAADMATVQWCYVLWAWSWRDRHVLVSWGSATVWEKADVQH